MKETEDRDRGRLLISAVERILDDPDEIIGVVERHRRTLRDEHPHLAQDDLRDLVAERVVRHWSNRAAFSGGATALPALMPGIGTLVAVAGGTLVDVGLLLKYEVEMAMALCWLYGYDIRLERERQLAFLLASVETHDARAEAHFLEDVAQAEGQAIWNYGPRQVPKIAAQVVSRLATRGATRGLARALPFLGIAVGVGLNKALTAQVGRHCIEELDKRLVSDEALRKKSEARQPDVVDAVVPGEPSQPAGDGVHDPVTATAREPAARKRSSEAAKARATKAKTAKATEAKATKTKAAKAKTAKATKTKATKAKTAKAKTAKAKATKTRATKARATKVGKAAKTGKRSPGGGDRS